MSGRKVDIDFAGTRRALAALRAAGVDFETVWAQQRTGIRDLTSRLGGGKLGESFQGVKDATEPLIESAGTVKDNYGNLATNAETGVTSYEAARDRALGALPD